MRTSLLTAMLLLLGLAVAEAQPVGVFVAGPAGAVGPFSGPCDQGVTCTDGWGAERLTSGYSGKALNAINVGNSTTGDIGFDTNGGLLSSDLTSLGCTTDTSCKVVTFYSQFGSGCNLTQAGASNRAFIHVSTTENGHATVVFNGTDADSYVCTTGSTYTSATLISMVTPNTNAVSPALCGLTGGISPTLWASAAVLDAFSECVFSQGSWGGAGVPNTVLFGVVADSTANGHADGGSTMPAGLFCLISQHSASNVQLVVNGTASTAGNPGSVLGNGPHKHAVGSDRATSEGWTGEENAFVFINPAVSDGAATAIAHKMAQFWQASPTC